MTRIVEYPDITETHCLSCGWYLNIPLSERPKPDYANRAKRGKRQYPRTHCCHGHPYSKENTYLYKYKKGGLQKKCRICQREKSKDRQRTTQGVEG